MKVTYSILIPNNSFPNSNKKIIIGAKLEVENGFVPPSKDYRLLINSEVSFGIDRNNEGLTFDSNGNVFVNLYPDIYLDGGKSNLSETGYFLLCKDLKAMENNGWQIIYDNGFTVSK